jgi:3-hydroxyacyl-[acyl-carrier-protein] dehydratase
MNQTVQLPVDVRGIEALQPHRYPFLLVDSVVDFEPRRRIVAFKKVTCNEPFFNGHFPGNPVMPGVLIIEALAQAGGLLTTLTAKADGDGREGEKLFYLVKVDNAKFTRQVVPGDRLELEVELRRVIRNMAMYAGIARVDGEQVACAEILCAEAQR